MKKNNIFIIFALLLGLLAGYLIFGGSSTKDSSTANEEQNHYHEKVAQMWTCSMHPQIMLPEPGDCPICGMDLIPAHSNADGLSPDQFKMTKNAMALADIETSVVGDATKEGNTITLSGKIEVNRDKLYIQPAHFNGRIEKLYVTTLGQQVQTGQAVAKIYSPELVSAQQELITASKLKGSQPKLYEAVRNKFKNWRIHGGQLDKIEQTGKVLDKFTIYAHASGILTEISVNQGDHIMTGKAIFQVADLGTVWADFDAYENEIGALKKGQKINITTNAYPYKVIKAKISFIDPILNTGTRTVKVRAVLENKKGLFKPGMFVEGRLETGSLDTKQKLSIPSSAVLWTGQRSLVYLKANRDEPIFQMREVTLGNKIGDTYQVLDGLDPGEEIVTKGTFTVDAAAQLIGKKSMMNKGATVQKISISEDFQNRFKLILPSYFELKDALVASNPNMASSKAILMAQKMENLGNAQINLLAKKKVGKIKDMANLISKSNDLEYQRNHFATLSDAMNLLVSNLDHLNRKIYVQKCPMAKEHNGALWLSLENEIKNPYFGFSMPDCGSIINELGR